MIQPDFVSHHLPCPVSWWAPGRRDAWTNVWVSPEFQFLATTPSWLSRDVIPFLAARPIGWFDPPEGARFYFSALFMNAVMNRRYDNPLVQDLYVLHEALHAATLDGFADHIHDLRLAVRLNEIEVSLETECRVYLREPSWVGKTFDPLWVSAQNLFAGDQEEREDDVLDPDWYRLAVSSAWPTMDHRGLDLWNARRRATYAPQTPADHLVARYERLAHKWLDHIDHALPEIFAARRLLLSASPERFVDAVNQWSLLGARHCCSDLALPWGACMLGTSKLSSRAAA